MCGRLFVWFTFSDAPESRSIIADAQCLAHWERVKDQERWGAAWGLQAMAAADRVELALGAYMDTIYQLVQPHALAFPEVRS